MLLTQTEKLAKLKLLLENPVASDDILTFCLDNASDIICDLRNSDVVEKKYETVQLKMAIELFNKRGAEGETSHSENGVSRSYDGGDISKALLSQVTQVTKTPFSVVRVIV